MSLAAKCEIPMDEIYCPQRSRILSPMMLNSVVERQGNNAPELQWTDVPPALLETSMCGADEVSLRDHRYIMVREDRNGQSRFLLTPAFQTQICSKWFIEQTWIGSDAPVVKAFLGGDSDFHKFTKAVEYQVARYHQPNRKPECVRVNGLCVIMAPGLSSQTRIMDLILSFELVNLDHGFCIIEFVQPKQRPSLSGPSYSNGGGPISPASTDTFTVFDNLESPTSVSDETCRLFDNLEELVEDPEVEKLLSFINESN